MPLRIPPTVAVSNRFGARMSASKTSVKGGLRASIEAAPDVPVSRVLVTMRGGQKGLFVNSRDICERRYRATAKMVGHNNKRSEFNPVMSNSKCKKSHKKKHKKHKRARR
jgi:hypothetical protein